MLHCDLADVNAYANVLAGIELECGWVDFLANVAGVDEPVSAFDMDAALYRKILEVNFFAAVVGTLSVLPGMARRGFGSILNCSSNSVRTPIAYESPYVASKGALSALTESVALEVRSFGVIVRILYPGFVETPLAVRSLERGMKRPARAILRTTEQVSSTALNGLGRGAIGINAAKATPSPDAPCPHTALVPTCHGGTRHADVSRCTAGIDERPVSLTAAKLHTRSACPERCQRRMDLESPGLR